MREIEVALSRLDKVKPVAGGYQARCPCHDDRVSSLSVAENKGTFLAYCHAGCSFQSIVKALDLHPDSETLLAPTITATYDYTDKEGNLLYQVVRYHPKTFKQRRPDGNGGWVWDLKGIVPTLYHLPELLTAKMVWVVEGEKDVDNLRKQGQTATTISGGASSKWHPALVTLFFSKDVAIIPDNDEPGRAYAQYVANLLFGIAKSVKIVTLPVKDVSDYLKTNSIDDLLGLMNNSEDYIPKGIVTREEFEELRGINIFLIKRWLPGKSKVKKELYDSV